MTKKILTWGIVGGFVLFFWGFVDHELLPIGEAGFRILPDDGALLEFASTHMAEPGIYFYPRLDPSKGEAEMQKWMEKAASGPSGLIVHRPRGGMGMTPRLLLNELMSNIACAIIAAFLVAQLGPMGFARKAFCVTLLGVLAWLSVVYSEWNWYGFPVAYTLAAFADQGVGFALLGLLLAWAFKD
jgi:hypothetical protein